MIEIDDDGSRLLVTDAEKNEVHIGVEAWRPGGDPACIDRRVHRRVSGVVSTLRFPEAAVCVESDSRARWRTFVSEPRPLSLERDGHLVQVETAVATYVRFDGSATLERRAEADELRLDFPAPTHVTLGFRSPVRRPTRTITVPPTPSGFATALDHLTIAHDTTTPDRSYPTLRTHPPLIEFGEAVEIPEDVRDARPETGIRLELPAAFPALFVAAPLVYYLQASVDLVDGPPRIAAQEAGVTRALGSLPRLQHDVADLLVRAFSLDCLVRNVGTYGTDLAEFALLDEIGLDPDRLYGATPADRLAAYLDAPFEAVASRLPEWHLSTHIKPVPEHVPAVSHLLDRLSLIYLPRTDPLERADLVARSLDDTYRSTGADRRASAATAVDPVLPTLHRGRVTGWLADDVPIDVYKAHPDAYDNRFEYLDGDSGPIAVTVVLNDPGMAAEQAEVSRIYRQRAEELSIELAIEEELDRDGLADVFENPVDFVHYIGHCEPDGLRCTDGALSTDELGRSRAQTFFLNACGSYEEGMELVRKGSVAGAVTLHDVLDDQATRVGTTFGRLLIHGFSIEQALRLARRRAIMNKHYLAVGDGTHVLSQGVDEYPSVSRIDHHPDCKNRFIFTTQAFSARDIGGIYQSYLSDGSNHYLFGNESSTEVSLPELLNHLESTPIPLIYDGQYYWSGDLYNTLPSE